MLPPPMTRPTDAPKRVTPTTSSQRRVIVSKSNPNPLSPASASPDSLIRTRGYLSAVKRFSRLADLESREATDLNVLAGLRGHLLHEIADGLLVVPDPRLVEQRDVL